jgi:hypothetical protein
VTLACKALYDHGQVVDVNTADEVRSIAEESVAALRQRDVNAAAGAVNSGGSKN